MTSLMSQCGLQQLFGISSRVSDPKLNTTLPQLVVGLQGGNRSLMSRRLQHGKKLDLIPEDRQARAASI